MASRDPAYVCPECGESHAEPGFCPYHGAELVRARDRLLGCTIGRYRLARRLGRGASGVVYLAVQPEIGSRVAIKLLSPQSAIDQAMVRRFEAEARASNLIQHENIVKVFDLLRFRDRPAIVMEYLEGAPLGDYLADCRASRGPLPVSALARITSNALDALDAAHRRGIVHRDLKPDNLYVTRTGRTVVLDFGMAKLRACDEPRGPGAPALTATGAILGTPDYLSPEQARAQPLDHRTDIYSAGVILFEAATGRRPFEADSVFELLQMHVWAPPPPPRSLRRDLPVALEGCILRALAKRPDDRFATMAEMDVALRAAAGLSPRRRRSAAPPAWSPDGAPRASEPRRDPTFSRRRGIGQMTYRNGKLEGFWTYWDDRGELVKVESYEQGELVATVSYRAGKPVG